MKTILFVDDNRNIREFCRRELEAESTSVNRRSGPRLRHRGMMRADLRDILRIEANVFEHPWSEDDFIQHLQDPRSVALLLEGDNDIVGYMVFGFDRPWLNLFSCVVQRTHQRRGIGSTMVAHLLEIVNTRAWRGIRVKVPERRVSAQLFFRHCGFRAVRTLSEYLLDGQDVYVMEYAVLQSSNQDGVGTCEDDELIPLWEVKHG